MKRSPIALMSKSRRAELAERRQVVADCLHRDRGCVLSGALEGRDAPCGGPLDGHEVLPKGRGGDWLDRDNVVTLCRSHHDLVHAHPAWSETVGLLKPSGVLA